MSSRARWTVGLAVGAAGLAAIAWLAVRALDGDGAGAPPAGDASMATARVDAGARVALADADLGPPKPVPPIRMPVDSPDRPAPYRPATYLRFSAGQPAANPADDDASPTLARILDLTKPDGEQEQLIRAAWRAHEDGRRELVAAAPPPSIGDPAVDLRDLAEIDRAFEETLAAILRHEQLARLVLEMPPPTPEPEPPAPTP